MACLEGGLDPFGYLFFFFSPSTITDFISIFFFFWTQNIISREKFQIIYKYVFIFCQWTWIQKSISSFLCKTWILKSTKREEKKGPVVVFNTIVKFFFFFPTKRDTRHFFLVVCSIFYVWGSAATLSDTRAIPVRGTDLIGRYPRSEKPTARRMVKRDGTGQSRNAHIQNRLDSLE